MEAAVDNGVSSNRTTGYIINFTIVFFIKDEEQLSLRRVEEVAARRNPTTGQKFINELLHGLNVNDYLAGRSVTGQACSKLCLATKHGIPASDRSHILSKWLGYNNSNNNSVRELI